MPTMDSGGWGMADSFMSTHVLSQPGEYDGAAQSSAAKSNLYTSDWVGGSAPGSFFTELAHSQLGQRFQHLRVAARPGARRAARYDEHAAGAG